MSEEAIKEIADNANMIIAGYCYTVTDNGMIRALNLENTEEACVLDPEGNVIETTMDDQSQALVQAYYMKNRDLLEEENA